jgi:cysteinyl-tRNA synthetase
MNGEDLPPGIWEQAVQAQMQLEKRRQAVPQKPDVPEDVSKLVQARQAARDQKDWAESDALRAQIAALGWQVKDTPDGPVVEPVE